ncbi:MAG: hypothetical protein PHO83_07940 [Geobacteraceae bacterium]|nr:hypothetical protein [Geobacteraceae bacterium]
MKKISLIAVVLLFVAGAAQAAGAVPDMELDEVFALYSEHKDTYDSCYQLAVSKVLTGAMREEILHGAADQRKGMACALAITSVEAGIRITDIASLEKFRDYFKNKVGCVAAKVDLQNAKAALEMYCLDMGRYPATLDEVVGSYVMSFRSKMTYRLEADQARYMISATNEGCDKTLFISSDSADIGSGAKSGLIVPK